MNESGIPEPSPAGRLLLLSPHLDDAVLGCGRLLASTPGATVATILAGRPDPAEPLTGWDRDCGFKPGDDVVGQRREEDRAALETLGARSRWLDFLDAQYGGAAPEAVAAGLARLLDEVRPGTLLIPLGLFHSDHRLVHRAALSLLEGFPDCRWLAYEDGLYRRLDGVVAEALAGLRARGLAPRPVRFAEAADAAARKAAAVACYRSQLKALATPGRPGHPGSGEGEAYWQLRQREAQP